MRRLTCYLFGRPTCYLISVSACDSNLAMSDPGSSFPLLAPAPITHPDEIDLEAGPGEQFQCRICLESDAPHTPLGAHLSPRTELIAPCKCKGTSKYVHRECLDQWRAVKEGFAFAHCTTCKAPYHLRVCVQANRRWRIFKFQFFVTRDVVLIFAIVQLIISSLAYLVYLIDSHAKFWLRLTWGFDGEISFYYLCGAILFFVLLGLSGCFITCFDQGVQRDLSQPCQELCLCCCQPRVGVNYHVHDTPCIWIDCNICCENCADTTRDCQCLIRSNEGEAGLPVLFILGLILLGLFAVIGIFYGVLVATMVAQRIWQRNYHILAKRMLTKEYVVEDVGNGADWRPPPPLSAEHVQQLKSLGLF